MNSSLFCIHLLFLFAMMIQPGISRAQVQVQKFNPPFPSSASTSTSTSPVVTIPTKKTPFRGPESNCAQSFDPCYFPKSICCKWQSQCPYTMDEADCVDDKEDFCCKYM